MAHELTNCSNRARKYNKKGGGGNGRRAEGEGGGRWREGMHAYGSKWTDGWMDVMDGLIGWVD
jgi:hypothetical protein